MRPAAWNPRGSWGWGWGVLRSAITHDRAPYQRPSGSSHLGGHDAQVNSRRGCPPRDPDVPASPGVPASRARVPAEGRPSLPGPTHRGRRRQRRRDCSRWSDSDPSSRHRHPHLAPEPWDQPPGATSGLSRMLGGLGISMVCRFLPPPVRWCGVHVMHLPDVPKPCVQTVCSSFAGALSGHIGYNHLQFRLPFLSLCTSNVEQVFPVAETVKNLPAMQETRIRSLGWEVPMQEGMAIHSSTLAWRIPWTEKPGGLQSVRLKESDTPVRLTHTQC